MQCNEEKASRALQDLTGIIQDMEGYLRAVKEAKRRERAGQQEDEDDDENEDDIVADLDGGLNEFMKRQSTEQD